MHASCPTCTDADGRFQAALSGLSTEADRQSVDAFFKVRIPLAPRYVARRARAVLTSLVLAVQDKDTGKYNLALAQALDGIKAKSAWIAVRVSSLFLVLVLASVLTIRWRASQRSSADIQQWLDKWEQGAKL